MYYKDKLNLFVALAPVTKITLTKSALLRHVDDHYDWLTWFLNRRDIHEVFGYLWTISFKIVCGTELNFCTWSEGYLITQNPEFDDADRFQVYMGHLPGGSSVK